MEAAEIILINEFRHSPGLIEQLEEPNSLQKGEKEPARYAEQSTHGIFSTRNPLWKVGKISSYRQASQNSTKKLEPESIEAAQSAIAHNQCESERELLKSARDYLAEWLVKSAVEVAFNTQRFITEQDLRNTEKKNPQFGCRLLLTDSTNPEQSDVTLLLGELIIVLLLS